MKSLPKVINILFCILFFLTPLILWPYNSELFEFNKIIIVYIFTVLITATWAARMVAEKKIIFRRTILDIPLLIFLGSQIISTLFSIDILTSLFGYYSRFNGGLFSIISYALLYWAFVSNTKRPEINRIISITLLSAVLVSIYGVLEHFGIDKNIWQQDVQSRVFSTLGQPNWLAAWLVALIPITWFQILDRKDSKFSFSTVVPYMLSTLFFLVLLFTKSRSGLIGFVTTEIVFWTIIFIRQKGKPIKKFLIINAFIALTALILGTQFSPSFLEIFSTVGTNNSETKEETGTTVLESGGTESGTIRKIVWKGAVDVWKHYPIFGTGVETFAYSYYFYRPAEHNTTSEWDYIYNKAHNEYLNYLANTGSVGFLAYLALIIISILQISNFKLKPAENRQRETGNLNAALLAGFFSILATNFFGFSVVPIQILFYLYPAFADASSYGDQTDTKIGKNIFDPRQKTILFILSAVVFYLLVVICRYWYADVLYAKGLGYNRINRQDIALDYLNRAVKLQPNQNVYYSELSKSYVGLALAYNEAKEATSAANLANMAIETSAKAVNLNPANVNLKRIEFGIFLILSSLDPNYLLNAKDVLVTAVKQAPTDAKLYYNLGLIYWKVGQNQLALETLRKTVELKSDYEDARIAYAGILIDTKDYSEAKSQLEYVLTNLDPGSTVAKQYLESIK